MNFLRKIFHNIPFLPWLYHLTLALAGAVIYGFPSRKIFVVGVTGTKGKSTIIELIDFILQKAGRKVAVISSTKIKVGQNSRENLTETTMPGRFFIQRFLKKAVNAGCQYAILEVTSEGVAFNRHRFINWQAAIFINLHPEHIEVHGSFEKYREAKLKFFKYAKNLFFINRDDRQSRLFAEAADKGRIILFSKSNLQSRLAGEFNKYNIGAAAAFARSQGITDDVIKKAIASFPGFPGRMEFIQKKPFAVVIDYAHTPDSLREVYESLKNSKLICVLGSCGGGRDRWKRPELGRIAGQYCDQIILTNEDPFDEKPETIIDEIAAGCPQADRIIDRKEAIRKAIELAKPGDAVVITGKGSESFIRVAGGKKIPWSDKQAVIDLLSPNKPL